MMDDSSKLVGSTEVTSVSWEVEESMGHIATMLKQESSVYTPCFDYLKQIQTQDSSENAIECVNEGWRRKICEWAFSVVDHFGFDREVVSIALSYLDRAIAVSTQTTGTSLLKTEFQLAAVASLYLAIKLHGATDGSEGVPQKLRINAFVALSRHNFSVEDIETMECDILFALEWRINPPTTVAFVASFLRLLPVAWNGRPMHPFVASYIFEMARYLTELSVCISSFSFHFKSSEIAYAAILCSVVALRDQVPFPDDARIAFLNALAGATSLTPNSPKISEACAKLMELAPIMFTGISRSNSISSAKRMEVVPPEGCKASPIRVCDGPQEEFIQRKRARSIHTME